MLMLNVDAKFVPSAITNYHITNHEQQVPRGRDKIIVCPPSLLYVGIFSLSISLSFLPPFLAHIT
jgi:hypothetical protein